MSPDDIKDLNADYIETGYWLYAACDADNENRACYLMTLHESLSAMADRVGRLRQAVKSDELRNAGQ